jgi:tetratricopeptide (TPR) repeat protein
MGWVVAACLAIALQVGFAQKRPATGTPDETRKILVEKARALEARGRPDMAIQLWQQILLSDPKSTDALAGLAKDYKLIGSSEQSNAALARLRSVNPNDPNIAKIEGLTSTRLQSDRLRQAGELARRGKPEEAMRIYRDLYGDRPPDGDIALAYYQTLYGAPGGKETAIAAMRALAARNPGDTRFIVELGVMLTYDAKTRAEGIRILEVHPKDSNAQTALRQALIWDSANPASAAELREYLKEHPQDTELAGHLKENESKLAQMNSGIARTPAERAAFAALNAHKLEEAQARFTEILQQEPTNGRAAAGMGFLRMQQNNFGGAISYLTQAEQNGYKDRAVADALVTSRFWYTMGEASQAFDENQFEVAAAKYKAALAMRPRSQEALNGLAGLYVKEQQFTAAVDVYEQLIKVQPNSTTAWRGLFLSYARDGQNQKALALTSRFPAPVRAAVAKDPEYLRTLATIYRAENRSPDAQRVLAQALALPYPDNGTNLKADTRLQYAGILMEAHRFDQAAQLYTQILTEDAANLSAWMGLVSAHHELGQDNEAIADVEKMPPSTYDTALADPGFLSMLGAIYQQANQFDVAQGLLERSVKLQIAAGGQPAIPLQLQLAAIYLLRNDTGQAYAIYRQVLEAHPDRVDAWKGLIATLQATNRNTEALQEIALIPPPVRKELEADIEFLQGEASLYAASGDIAHATEYMNRVQVHYRDLKTVPPANVEVQNAWLLFNTGNDRALYPALMRLGGRQDLTNVQREAVQDIWANWSVRRAGAAMDNGNIQRAVDILDAASQAFPDNMTVRKAVAGGYVRVGRAKESLALFKTIPMQDATAGDFQAAIGAALAANDKAQAENWLRQALERFGKNPAILALAARYEQARGDNQRAADYWRASLATMPKASPADRLAHTLVYPDQDMKARRAVTATDLQHLLDPNYEPFQKTTKVPPLPAYGSDPYSGRAPVDLSQPQPAPQQNQAPPQDQAPQQNQWVDGPSNADIPLSNPQAANSAATSFPVAQAAGRQGATQVAVSQPSAGNGGSATSGTANSRTAKSSNQSKYMGVMHLPASGQSTRSPGPIPSRVGTPYRQQPSVPQPSLAEVLSPDQPSPESALGVAPSRPSLAGDAWKGLIFSLLAGNRIAEAFQQIAQIPPDVRRQLEADVEFVQGEASLYAASGDIPRATEYIRRVESYYLLRRTPAPAGIEVQSAWLLYNTGNDRALYPVLRGLDGRQDLTAEQRQEVQTIWTNWSLRRAVASMDAGDPKQAVDILEAAERNFPDNLSVRRAVAGGYLRVGRVGESLHLFKATPMQDANAGDYQGAIGAALTAHDLVQAEAWLRQALSRYPADAGVLAAAANFEKARGNNRRASEYWRASLAAGSPTRKFDTAPVYSTEENGVRPATGPGDLRNLLDPDIQPPAKSFALPGSGPNSLNLTGVPPLAASQGSNLAGLATPGRQGNALTNAPIYIPRPAMPKSGQPVFIEQSARQSAVFRQVSSQSQAGKPVPSGPNSQNSAGSPSYSGRVQLPPSEENIDSTDPDPSGNPAQNPQQAPTPRKASPSAGLRITSQPMGELAAQVQALFAEQTDSQLTQGSAANIRVLNYAPVKPATTAQATPAAPVRYSTAQYTPSAQEAATGAYSAPKQKQNQPAQPQAQQTAPPASTPPVAKAAKKPKKQKQALPAVETRQPARTLGTIPVPAPQQQVQLPEGPATQAPASTSSGSTTTGLTDEELQQRNLPPLRGPWVRIQREQRTTSPRDEAEMQLRSIESGYSPWAGGAGVLNYRSGDLGYDHLSALEAPFEASVAMGYNARLTIVAKPVFLDSGQADGTSVITVLEGTTSGNTLVTIPQPLGTDTNTSTTSTTTGGGVPPQQNAVGIGGEVQLAFPHLALAGGYTPTGFLVANVNGRAFFRPGNGPFTFNFSRDSVRDTQLSYAGLRDPGSASLSFPGNIWGGVVANQGSAQYSKGDAESGFYLGAGGQYLTGHNVVSNTRIDGSGGAYWRLRTVPEYGNLSIGVNFFGMHYSQNEDAFTWKNGGYFSPQAYFLANVPFTWAAHYGTKWHYNVLGSFGVQAFQEDQTPLFPGTAITEYLPAKTSVGPNYDLRSQAAYQIGPHWFAGGFFSANNSRNYSAVSAGFYVRFLFREQPSTVTAPTGIFPTDGLRPFSVP